MGGQLDGGGPGECLADGGAAFGVGEALIIDQCGVEELEAPVQVERVDLLAEGLKCLGPSDIQVVNGELG